MRGLAAFAMLLSCLGPIAAGAAEPSPRMLPEGRCEYVDERVADRSFAEQVAVCVAAAPSKVVVDGDRLTLPLASGATKEYVSNTAACRDHVADRCVIFTYLGYLAPIDSYLIDYHCYEYCLDRFLVSATTGAEVRLEALPQFSPDLKRFVVVAASNVDYLKTPDVRLFEIDQRQAKEAFNYSSRRDYEYWAFEAWVGSEIADITVSYRIEDCGERRLAAAIGTDPPPPTDPKKPQTFVDRQPIKLIRLDGRWQLHPSIACDKGAIANRDRYVVGSDVTHTQFTAGN